MDKIPVSIDNFVNIVHVKKFLNCTDHRIHDMIKDGNGNSIGPDLLLKYKNSNSIIIKFKFIEDINQNLIINDIKLEIVNSGNNYKSSETIPYEILTELFTLIGRKFCFKEYDELVAINLTGVTKNLINRDDWTITLDNVIKSLDNSNIKILNVDDAFKVEKPKHKYANEWLNFRNSGFFWFINQILHAFGWVIIIDIDDATAEIKNVYPSRTSYRGFSEETQARGMAKISSYLRENIVDINDTSQENLKEFEIGRHKNE